MENLKHTPGPWLTDQTLNSDVPEMAIPIILEPLENNAFRWLASVHVQFKDVTKDRGQAIANAKLIAAAPDLLEALILANEMLFSVAVDAYLANKIELAIKKATQ